MLLIRLSVGVGKEHAEEVVTKLHDEFGAEIIRTSFYDEEFLESLIPNERVYIDFCAPYDSLKYITTWLHSDFNGNALLTY